MDEYSRDMTGYGLTPPKADRPGDTIRRWFDELARCSDDEDRITRLFLSKAHAASIDLIGRWMELAGMTTSIDAIGNLCGSYRGTIPGAPTLILGSHIDTVKNAGQYDGTLGVLVAIAAIAEFNRRRERFPFSIDVIGFGDEEGVRFPSTLAGSRAIAGTFDPATLSNVDSDGISLRDALLAFGCNPQSIMKAARSRHQALAYIEVHIEQGPILEENDLPVAIVSGIVGATRAQVKVVGTAGHAGTVPMSMRKDALAGAAEMMLAIEREARKSTDLVATVGVIECNMAAVNVIPSEVHFTIDLRSSSDAIRGDAISRIRSELVKIASKRGLEVGFEPFHDAPAVKCSSILIEQLSSSVARSGLRPLQLPSGAGHDAMAVASLCPIGMLFVRCKGGISHSPLEFVRETDAIVAIDILLDFLRHFDSEKICSREHLPS